MNSDIEALKTELSQAIIERDKLAAKFSQHEQLAATLDMSALNEATQELAAMEQRLSEALTAQALGNQPTDLGITRHHVARLSKKVATERELVDSAQREYRMTATTLQTLVGEASARIGSLQARCSALVVPMIEAKARELIAAYEVDARKAARTYVSVGRLIDELTDLTGQDPGLWGMYSRTFRAPGFDGQARDFLTGKDLPAYRVDAEVFLRSVTDGLNLQHRVAPQAHDTPHGLAQQHQMEIYR